MSRKSSVTPATNTIRMRIPMRFSREGISTPCSGSNSDFSNQHDDDDDDNEVRQSMFISSLSMKSTVTSAPNMMMMRRNPMWFKGSENPRTN